MQPSAGVLPRSTRPGPLVRGVPSLLESLWTIAAIVVLLPAFLQLAGTGAGRDQRFADPGFGVQGLPEPTLPALCADIGALAEPALHERWCGSVTARAVAAPPSRVPAALAETLARARRAFAEPIAQAEARRNQLRVQQREGLGELRGLADEIAALEARTQPFADRFQIASSADGPAALACAAQWVDAALAGTETAHGSARANAVLLLAAALDGQGATAAL
ncbi:MAG TPA: hypothetical protein VGP22_02370, partial [Albitalea sp.]|nr:hypothetical protein [Albitalea sp.]